MQRETMQLRSVNPFQERVCYSFNTLGGKLRIEWQTQHLRSSFFGVR